MAFLTINNGGWTFTANKRGAWDLWQSLEADAKSGVALSKGLSATLEALRGVFEGRRKPKGPAILSAKKKLL